MCKTYNMIGSLSSIKLHLERNNIYDFKSLKDIMNFQNDYSAFRQQIISHHENLIHQEKLNLEIELQKLGLEIDTQREQSEKRLIEELNELKSQLYILANQPTANVFQKFSKSLRLNNYRNKVKRKEFLFEEEVKKSILNLLTVYQEKTNRFQFINSDFSGAVKLSSQESLTELDRKRNIINELNSFIYGALGEHKVVKTLETLSDDYFLINDFSISFSPAIYYSQENSYIKSIQIDHILISPAGVFLIETKNWSEKSLENLNLHSPVQQIKRASFVLFKLLNNEFSNFHFRLNKHHWGDKKIPIKNLIVLTKSKPKEEFQFVKILTLTELLGYVGYFKPSFSSLETKRITDFLLRINDEKTIETN